MDTPASRNGPDWQRVERRITTPIFEVGTHLCVRPTDQPTDRQVHVRINAYGGIVRGAPVVVDHTKPWADTMCRVAVVTRVRAHFGRDIKRTREPSLQS